MRVSPVRLSSDFQVFGNGNVRPHRLVFDPSDPASLSLADDGDLTVRLIAPADTDEAMLTVRTESEILGYSLGRVGAAGAVSVWEAVFEPPADQFECAFGVRLGGGVAAYLAPTGVTSAIERLDRFRINVDDLEVHDVPSWAEGAVIYQIFPDRFANGDRSLDPGDVETWDAVPDSGSFKGGDLAGIATRVDHLVGLGVGAVYLNPIFTSPSNHRYDTVDYLAVDTMLGGDDALRELVETLHGAGIRLMLDTSLNHCHPRFFAFADVVVNGLDSAYAAWFAVDDWPVRVIHRPHLLEPGSYWKRHLERLEAETGVPVEIRKDDGLAVEPTYEAWYGVPMMPRIDLSNPEARRYMLDVATYWIRDFDVDGWRMDVVRYIDHDFWAEMRREVRSLKPDAFLLAEVMGDARRWLRGEEFDATMNYTFRELCLDYFATSRIGTPAFLEGLLEMTAMYSPAVASVNHNLLGSHDTPRFLTLAGGDARSLLLATLVQATFPGAPGLYYGDELPMAGEGDPDNRRGFDWSMVGGEHHDHVRRLLSVRIGSPALRNGRFSLIGTSGDAFAYRRTTADEAAVIGVNHGARAGTIAVPGVSGEVRWHVGEAALRAGSLRLGPHSGAVIIE